MSKNNENFKDVTLEDVARMIADGFSDINERMATKKEMREGFEEVDKRFEEVDKRFDEVDRKLGAHMTDVREQTDSLAYRTKRLEQTVYGVGK